MQKPALALCNVGLLSLCLAMLLMGCTSTPLATGKEGSHTEVGSVTPSQTLGGLPVPTGARLLIEQSLLVGPGQQWVGRAVLDAGRDTDAIFNFFASSLPAQGWTELTSVRGKTSFMVFIRTERTLSIEMSESLVSTPVVMLTMAPRKPEIPLSAIAQPSARAIPPTLPSPVASSPPAETTTPPAPAEKKRRSL